MKCANCGTESTGNFCPSCGASMRATACASCGAGLVAGARFCTRCGTSAAGDAAATPAGAAPAPGRQPLPRAAAAGSAPSNLPWYIAGGILLVLALILVVPMITGSAEDAGPPVQGAPFAGGAAGGSGTPPPLTGTPRDQADQLFDRIMRERQAGNDAVVAQFTPMAINAYAMAEPLDHDGRYHLATVHVAAGDYPAAIAEAEKILAAEPNHLLGLGIAAEAATLAGDSAAARDYSGRLLAAWDTENSRSLQEYLDHARILPEYQAAAQAATR